MARKNRKMNLKTSRSLKTVVLEHVSDILIPSVFVLSPIVARFYANTLTNTFPVQTLTLLPWFRGVASDAAVGLLLGAIVCLLPIKRTAQFALWAIWTVVLSLDTAHILVNQSHANIRFASLGLHKDFILGSVFALSNLVIIIVIAAIALAFGVLLQRFTFSSVRTFVLLAASLLAASVTMVIPRSLNSPDWLQMSALEANFQIQSRGPAHILKQNFPERIRKRFLYSDLSGTSMFASPDKPQNVLLLIMEGIKFDTVKTGDMPYLKKLGEQNVLYSNFISQQRQTNRGLFALLCGDYPNFLTRESKSDYFGAFGSPRACLPDILSNNSYSTMFLQGANLGYMGKDQFATAIGYHEVMGNASFKNPLGRTEWGVDDLTLFRRARVMARDLSARGSPWFLTVLTAGTHHPFNVPNVTLPKLPDAILYLDNALKEIVEGLREDGTLENTLVLITSDEAGKNHIPMVALIPGYDSPFDQQGFYTQVDLQLSILDYFGIPVQGSIGRSIFRSYPTGREFVFGNNYKNRVHMINTTTNTHVWCSTLSFKCLTNGKGGDTQAVFRDFLTFLQHNDLDSRNFPDGTLFHLTDATYTGYREIMGDRKVVLAKGDTLTFQLNLLADGPLTVSVALDGSAILLEKQYSALKGNTVKFKFTHTSDRDGFAVFHNLYVLTDPYTSYTIKDLLITKVKARGS